MNDSTDIRSHFELTAMPCTRELPIERRWRHPQYEAAAQDILDAVHARLSVALITPSGYGKTVVLRTVDAALPEARYRVHETKVAGLSKRDFCRHICQAVGARPAGHTGALVDALQERCLALADNESVRPVLLIDEAHDLRPDVLAILRILTNFEMDSRLVLSIVLCGQPPLRTHLRRPELEDVCNRIATFATLRALDRQESADYLRHRLQIAGARDEIFSQTAQDAVYECAQGNLRATDRIALAAMRVAMHAGVRVVGADHVATARTKVAP